MKGKGFVIRKRHGKRNSQSTTQLALEHPRHPVRQRGAGAQCHHPPEQGGVNSLMNLQKKQEAGQRTHNTEVEGFLHSSSSKCLWLQHQLRPQPFLGGWGLLVSKWFKISDFKSLIALFNKIAEFLVNWCLEEMGWIRVIAGPAGGKTNYTEATWGISELAWCCTWKQNG